ncbi:TPA: nickel-dependent lactate racemase [Candidatus Bathyarchaeota archaeon]|nr:nickel-dependent lactate racemase [Candidatus Bathyarchaeota archaeon]
MLIKFPYGKAEIEVDIPDRNLLSVLESRKIKPPLDSYSTIKNALINPIKHRTLSEVANKANKICIIVSDYTRATPNNLLLPPILKEIEESGKNLESVKVLVANGLHKPAPENELKEILGEKILTQVNVINHDAEDYEALRYVGRTSFGTEVYVNETILDSELIVMTGLIEPHFFAGYSGGRKSILPGVAGRDSIYQNHSYKMIAHPMSRYGVLDGNPIHEDMVEAAEMALKEKGYIVNVVIDKNGKILKTFAGNLIEAHRKGVKYLDSIVKVYTPKPADVVVTTNGGYPLDRDLYQSVKGMATGKSVIRKNGVIIVLSECIDGIGRGHEPFYRLMAEAKTPENVLERIKQEEPIKDQWEAQVLAQILTEAHVILVTRNIKHNVIEEMHIKPASNIEEALEIAKETVGKDSKIISIPEGPYLIPAVSLMFKSPQHNMLRGVND